MTDIPENGSGVEPKLSISGQPKAKGAEVPVAGRRKMVKPKMDFAKALSIMGFSTSRTLDPSGGHDAKVELNAALSRKMADIEKRKRASSKKEEKNKSKLKPHKCILIILTHTGNDFQKWESSHVHSSLLRIKVISVGSDTFGNPIFHEGLQN